MSTLERIDMDRQMIVSRLVARSFGSINQISKRLERTRVGAAFKRI